MAASTSSRRPLRRITRWFGAYLALIFIIVVARAAIPLSTRGLGAEPEATGSYAEAVDRFQASTRRRGRQRVRTVRVDPARPRSGPTARSCSLPRSDELPQAVPGVRTAPPRSGLQRSRAAGARTTPRVQGVATSAFTNLANRPPDLSLPGPRSSTMRTQASRSGRSLRCSCWPEKVEQSTGDRPANGEVVMLLNPDDDQVDLSMPRASGSGGATPMERPPSTPACHRPTPRRHRRGPTRRRRDGRQSGAVRATRCRRAGTAP